jgi:RNA-directed DNA polymerase
VAKAKPFDISKREVWEAFKKVKANQGAAGVDGQTIAEFEADLSNNLYRLWNRMSSGSYFPRQCGGLTFPRAMDGPGRWVFQRSVTESHRKSSNGIWSPSWNPSSMMTPMDTAPADRRSTPSRRPDGAAGGSTGCSILTSRAILTASIGCCCSRQFATIRIAHGRFSIFERWLKAPVEIKDGSVVPRTAGTPQGGVVSPVLVNLFLHYAFDRWMARSFSFIPFERYADDIICHCRSEEEARRLWNALEVRFRACRLVLHPT